MRACHSQEGQPDQPHKGGPRADQGLEVRHLPLYNQSEILLGGAHEETAQGHLARTSQN